VSLPGRITGTVIALGRRRDATAEGRRGFVQSSTTWGPSASPKTRSTSGRPRSCASCRQAGDTRSAQAELEQGVVRRALEPGDRSSARPSTCGGCAAPSHGRSRSSPASRDAGQLAVGRP
jgi:hypothetical protein